MTQAWAMQASATGSARGWIATRAMPATRNGTTWATVVAVQSSPRRRRRTRSRRGRQATVASSGSGAPPGGSSVTGALTGPGAALAAGDRAAQDDDVGVARQRADVLCPAGPRRHHGDGARVQLLAERGDGGLDAGGVVGAPLR